MIIPDTSLDVLSSHSLRQIIREGEKEISRLSDELLAYAKEVLAGGAVEELQRKIAPVQDMIKIMEKSAAQIHEELEARDADENHPMRRRRRKKAQDAEPPEKLVVTPTPKAQGKAS